ncbi:MAG TPA: hypothetical protein DCM57_02285 [Treponema sp.]|nr:hypothetical protein [Treponema sp.]
MRILLTTLSSIVLIYALMCMVRIILTWIPNLSYSPFTRFLSSICDPWLNIFRGKKWLTMGSFDFGPAVAISILGAVSALLRGFTTGFHFGHLLALIAGLVWNIASAVIVFIVILLIIRLITILVSKNPYSNTMFEQIDRSVSSLVGNITRTFTGGRAVSYKAQLITAIISLIVIDIIGFFVFGIICNLFEAIPF